MLVLGLVPSLCALFCFRWLGDFAESVSESWVCYAEYQSSESRLLAEFCCEFSPSRFLFLVCILSFCLLHFESAIVES